MKAIWKSKDRHYIPKGTSNISGSLQDLPAICFSVFKTMYSWFRYIFFFLGGGHFNWLYWIDTSQVDRKAEGKWEGKSCGKGPQVRLWTWASHFQLCGIWSPAHPTEQSQRARVGYILDEVQQTSFEDSIDAPLFSLETKWTRTSGILNICTISI